MKLSGIALNKQKALSRMIVIHSIAIEDFRTVRIESCQVDDALVRVKQAVYNTVDHFEKMIGDAEKKEDDSLADILKAQRMMAKDAVFHGKIVERIKQEHCCAEGAVQLAVDELSAEFDRLEDEYFKERAQDVRDIGRMLLLGLTGQTEMQTVRLTHPAIIVIKELTPAMFVNMDTARLKGIVTEIGGRNCHAALLVKSLGKPAVFGCAGAVEAAKQLDKNALTFIDGKSGEVTFGIEKNQCAVFREAVLDQKKREQELDRLKESPTQTKDHVPVILAANVAMLEDIEAVNRVGAEGVGLFRTEFLYMNRSCAPTEAMQAKIYTTAAEHLNKGMLIIRTLDIGGDKPVAYLQMPEEQNPFLGYRAIRICLDMEDMFLTQIRAVLRASVKHNVAIMFPMISSLDELIAAKELVNTAKRQLKAEQVPFDEQIKIGMMIEVPSAAMMAPVLIQHVDFFSIGSNDLAQYMMAADRTNEKVSGIGDYFNPGFLKILDAVIKAAAVYDDKWVGICGDMAGDPRAAVLLLGLGIHELSVPASELLGIRRLLSEISMDSARNIAEKALLLETAKEVKHTLKGCLPNWVSEYF